MATNERIAPVDEVQLLRAAACDWRLSRGDVGVFAVILQHCDSEGLAFPGPTRIGQLARLSPTNVKASLRRLEVFEYVKVLRPGPRKANRFQVLDSPRVTSRKALKVIQDSNRELGMQTGPVSGKAAAETRYARMHPTRPVHVQQLGLSARQESTSKSLLKSQGDLTSSSEEQERSPEAEQRMTERARSCYLQAKRQGNRVLMKTLEENHRERLADLIDQERAA